jgi:hypothetical protein
VQKFTATAGQTTFTITGGYTVGMVDVFLNGVKLDNATEFTASNGSTVVLSSAAVVNDVVEVYKYGGQFIANNTLRQTTAFTATAGQTTFTVNYSVGFVDVFYNGAKLAAAEFTATNGTSIVLGTACVVNDIVEVVAYNYTVGAFTGVGGSGTTNYIPKWTASGTLGNSQIFDNGTNVGIGTNTPNDLLEVRGGFIRLSATAGNGPQFNLYSNGQTNSHVTLAQGFALATDNIGYLYNRANAAFVFGTNNSEKMRILANGNVGIGTTSPSALLTLAKNNNIAINTSDGNDDGYLAICGAGGDGSTRGGHIYLSGNERGADAGTAILSAGNVAGAFVGFRTGADIERMRITASGNVGIGIVPQSWSSSYRSLQVSNASLLNDVGPNTYLGTNTYVGTDNQWKYITNTSASIIGLESNAFVFYNASSGTSGSNISWVERIRFNSGGNLKFTAVPADNYQLDTSLPISIAPGGTITFAVFSGLIIVNNMANGVCAIWVCGAGGTSLIGQSINGAATGTLTYSGTYNGYVWTSNFGATANYGVFAVRTRNNA